MRIPEAYQNTTDYRLSFVRLEKLRKILKAIFITIFLFPIFIVIASIGNNSDNLALIIISLAYFLILLISVIVIFPIINKMKEIKLRQKKTENSIEFKL